MGLLSRITGFFKNRIRREPTGEPTEASPKNSVVQLRSSRWRSEIDRKYVSQEIGLDRVDEVYNNEAYAKRAIDKHIELMFKAGWDIIGDDEEAVEYIKKRLLLIAEMTKIPTNQLFVDIAEDLVKYSNAIVVKVRSRNNLYPGNLKAVGINNKDPICGYFPINLNYVEVDCDTAGNVYKWYINFPDTPKPLTLSPDDVIQFYYRRDKNNVFATPYLVSVIEDINALRQAEEGVLKQIYRNLNPFLHHIIGLEKDGYGGTQDEVDQARNVIENMDLEDGLITTERHKIEPIALDQVIDAYNYLRYFEQRVFTGLGVSETVMGRSGSASRATAESQYFDLRETVKAMQRVMESFINEFILKELLMEGGYDILFHPESNVEFRFREIDLDMKIKHENHVIYQYITNCITEDELRAELGRNPIVDRDKLFYNLVTIPVAQATGKNISVSPDDVINRTSPTNQPKKPKKAGRPSKQDKQTQQNTISDILLEICHYVTNTPYINKSDVGNIIAEVNTRAVKQFMLGEEINISKIVNDVLIERNPYDDSGREGTVA